MSMPLRTRTSRLVHSSAGFFAGLTICASAAAADYAAHDYGNTRVPPAESAQSAAPDSRPSHTVPASGTAPTSRDLPTRGTTMSAVRSAFGVPAAVRGPVGQPPITRWNYDRFHVYFEGNRVIHTVVPGDPEPIDDDAARRQRTP